MSFCYFFNFISSHGASKAPVAPVKWFSCQPVVPSGGDTKDYNWLTASTEIEQLWGRFYCLQQFFEKDAPSTRYMKRSQWSWVPQPTSKAIDKGYFCVAGVAASFEAACFPRCKLRYLFKKLLSIFLSRFGIYGPFWGTALWTAAALVHRVCYSKVTSWKSTFLMDCFLVQYWLACLVGPSAFRIATYLVPERHRFNYVFRQV